MTAGSAMALALASVDFCIRATFLVRASREALRLFPTVPTQDAADEDGEDGLGTAAAGGGLGIAVEDGAAADGGKDRLDHDIMLSTVSTPKVAGPWLRSS